jgi:hypothetical protein
MQPELLLRVLSHAFIGTFLVGFLFVLLVSLRKTLTEDTPIHGVVQLGLAVLGLCTFIALATAYFRARKIRAPVSFSQSVNTAAVSEQQERR